MNYIIIAIFLLVSSLSLADTSETVFMLSDDLESATKYYNKRGNGVGNYSFLFDQGFNTEQIMYARPENYDWRRTTHDGSKYKQLFFSAQKQHNRYFTFLLLPVALYAEFALLFQGLFLAAFYRVDESNKVHHH